VRSRAVDPRRNTCMKEVEEKVQKYFQELKDNLFFQELEDDLPSSSSYGWKIRFKKSVDEFIKLRLMEATCTAEMLLEDDDEERIRLHAIRRLVAGADQEWELVQQPEYAAECAKIDGALVWQGRGFVFLTCSLFLHLNHPPRVHLKKFRQRYGW
jgi:hypothetical protein